MVFESIQIGRGGSRESSGSGFEKGRNYMKSISGSHRCVCHGRVVSAPRYMKRALFAVYGLEMRLVLFQMVIIGRD